MFVIIVLECLKFQIPWTWLNNIVFYIVLEYLKLSDTLDMTENRCFSSFSGRFCFWVSENFRFLSMTKITVFYIIALEGPKISDTLEMTENHSIRYFLVGSALEYLKNSDSLDMTKKY